VEHEDLVRFVQNHFTDGLVIVVGSGLSEAEGIPGMRALAEHLLQSAVELSGEDAAAWSRVASVLTEGKGLEAALLEYAPSETLEAWIVRKTVEFLLPRELEVVREVVKGVRTLRLTTFLRKILKPQSGLPILTPNYDRLIEVACEMAGFHVDTTAIGLYAGRFDHERSCMASCRGRKQVGKTVILEHFPRAVVLKPHGSFDWYRHGTGAVRCSLDLAADRLVITPGLNKYKAGYSAPFDKHRELANDHIKRSARLLVVGYGFNDDHLQTHLVKRIQDGVPTLILTLSASERVRKLALESPNCVCVFKAAGSEGITVLSRAGESEHQGPGLWDLGVLASEVLA
jgi:hypothetical protein